MGDDGEVRRIHYWEDKSYRLGVRKKSCALVQSMLIRFPSL
jgi:hypothetical protein